MKKMSREQILAEIDPKSRWGEKSVYEAFKYRTRMGSHKLAREEVKFIILNARKDKTSDGRRYNEKEFHCLTCLLDYAGLTEQGYDYLNNFLYLEHEANDRSYEPIRLQSELKILSVIKSATHFPIQFALPDKPNYIYRFDDLNKVIAAVKTGWVIPVYYQKSDSRGAYSPRWDCLQLKKSYCEANAVGEQSTIVHEAVHCLQDGKDWVMDVGHIESGAHLVQAIWLLKSGFGTYMNKTSNKRLKEGFKEVARKIVDVSVKKPGLVHKVSREDYKIMRDALKEYSRSYRKKMKSDEKRKKNDHGWLGRKAFRESYGF